MSQVREHNFSVSLDRFGAGAGQGLDARRPFSGVGGSTPAAGPAGRSSLMAQLFEDGTPGALSHE